MEIIKDDLMSINLFYLDLAGLNPLKRNDFKEKIKVFLLLLFLFYTLSGVSITICTTDNLETRAFCIGLLGPFAQAFFKGILQFLMNEDFLAIMENINKLQKIQDIKSKSSILNVMRKLKLLFLNCRLMYTLVAICLIFRPFFLKGNILPLEVYAPGSEKLHFYVIHYGFSILSIGAAALMIMTQDTSFLTFITYLTYHIELLNDAMMNTYEDKGNLKETVQRHTIVLRLLDGVEKVYSMLTMVVLAVNMVNICMSLFMFNQLGFSLSGIVFIIFLFSAVVQLFLYCFSGYHVAVKVEQTSFALYSSNWCENINKGKDMVFMLRRTNDIQYLTIGGIINLDLETFTEVVKKSVSFYAFLKAETQEEN